MLAGVTIPTSQERKEGDAVSTIKEKADLEAAQAETEFPDEPGAEPGAEPVEPVEPETGDDEEAEAEEQPAEPEQRGRKVKSPQEKFQDAFSAFVRKAAACFEIPPADVVVAPHPGVVGIMLPGFAEPRTHPDFKACPTCNGRGKILTGAVTGDDSKDWHVCPEPKCKGRGYWQKTVEQPPPPATGPLAVQATPTENGEWGDAPAWMGDPNLTPAG